MQQLVLFQMAAEAQSLSIAAKAKLEKQSKLSSNITASSSYFDDEDVSYGDIYDMYAEVFPMKRGNRPPPEGEKMYSTMKSNIVAVFSSLYP